MFVPTADEARTLKEGGGATVKRASEGASEEASQRTNSERRMASALACWLAGWLVQLGSPLAGVGLPSFCRMHARCMRRLS